MKEYCITHEEHKYHVECRNMVFKNLEQTEGEIQEDKETQEIFFRYFTFLMRRSLLVTKKSPGRRVWLLD